MAQLGSGFPGLGGHPSLSLHSPVDGTPLLCDGPGCCRRRGAQAVAGVVALLPSSWHGRPLPQLLPSFRTRKLGAYDRDVGVGNYSCALRAVLQSQVGTVGAADPRCRHEPAPLPRHVPRCCALGDRRTPRPAPPVIAPADGRDAEVGRPFRAISSTRQTASRTARRPAHSSGRPSWSTTRPLVGPKPPPVIASSRPRSGSATSTMSEEEGPAQIVAAHSC